MNKERASEYIYVFYSIANFKIFCISTGDFEASLFPLLSRLNKLVQIQKDYVTPEGCAQFWLSSVRWHYKQKASNLFWKTR